MSAFASHRRRGHDGIVCVVSGAAEERLGMLHEVGLGCGKKGVGG
jgi:hypothetical protein